MGEAESSSKIKHPSDLQDESSHIWQGTQLVIKSAAKWVPQFKPKRTRYRTWAEAGWLRQIQEPSRQSAFWLMAFPSWSRVSQRLSFALATNCFSLWGEKPPTPAQKSTFTRAILTREGGAFFRPRSASHGTPETAVERTSSRAGL